MKLYTRRGDGGETDLFGGQRVGKGDACIACIGAVDELNAAVGLCVVEAHAKGVAGGVWVGEVLGVVQSRLFEIGADLATPSPEDGEEAGDVSESAEKKTAARVVPRVSEEAVLELEGWIDEAVAGVTAMTCFILPGGTELSARLHVARTVCRRGERLCVALAEHEAMNDQVVVYLNRLSDLLFALARRANHDAGVADVPWVKG